MSAPRPGALQPVDRLQLTASGAPRPLTVRELACAAVAAATGEAADAASPETAALLRHLDPAGLGASWPAHHRAGRSARGGGASALATLADALALSPVEELAIAFLAAVEEDALVGRAVAAIQAPFPGSRPMAALLARAFAPAAGDADEAAVLHALTSGAAAVQGAIVAHEADGPLAERRLGLGGPLGHALAGHDGAWPGAEIALATPELPLGPSLLAELERQARALAANGGALIVRGGAPSERRAAAAVIAGILERRPVFFQEDGAAAGGAPPVERAAPGRLGGGAGFAPSLAPWALLRRLLPVFVYDLAPGDRRRVPELPAYAGPVVALAGPDGLLETRLSSAFEWTMIVPPQAERAALWIEAIGDARLAHELADQQRSGAGRIAQLGRAVKHRLALERAGAGAEAAPPRAPTLEDVHAAAWRSEGSGLAGLAQPIADQVPDEALVAPPNLRTDLDHLLLRCRARDRLHEGLGPSIRARHRAGVRALFVGPSGTGKTLAASWLAGRLATPLYRVDLAAITSKYIGETEKNLAQLLARAEQECVVLLFDEADAVFGRRTDVKDANDRFANAQTNYLLQRIETFDGIVLLTSNSRARFDAAFTRRFDAIVDFSLPAAEERRALWLSHLGDGHQLSPRALNRLAAAVDLAGGHIRNIVLLAAVLARAVQRRITWADVVAAVGAEYRKLGRQPPPEVHAAAE